MRMISRNATSAFISEGPRGRADRTLIFPTSPQSSSPSVITASTRTGALTLAVSLRALTNAGQSEIGLDNPRDQPEHETNPASL